MKYTSDESDSWELASKKIGALASAAALSKKKKCVYSFAKRCPYIIQIQCPVPQQWISDFHQSGRVRIPIGRCTVHKLTAWGQKILVKELCKFTFVDVIQRNVYRKAIVKRC